MVQPVQQGRSFAWMNHAALVLGSLGLSAAAGDRRVDLTIAHPSGDPGNLILDTPGAEYVVQWKSGSQSWSTSRQQTSSGTAAAVTGLTPGTTYTFRAMLRNDVGYLATSPEVSATPTGPPTGVTVSTLGSGRRFGYTYLNPTVSVQSANGNILEVQVQWRSSSQSFSTSRQLSYTLPVNFANRAIHSGISPGTTYHVRARMRNNAGWSDWSPVRSRVAVSPVAWSDVSGLRIDGPSSIGAGVSGTWTAYATNNDAFGNHQFYSSYMSARDSLDVGGETETLSGILAAPSGEQQVESLTTSLPNQGSATVNVWLNGDTVGANGEEELHASLDVTLT